MAAIYAADIFCDDCANLIKADICTALWDTPGCVVLPDGEIMEGFDTRDDLDEYLRDMDESSYDSDDYPKYCDDEEESNCKGCFYERENRVEAG